MPTYQYVCTQCDTPLEAVQKFSDAALTECPTCSGQLRKVFSAVGVVFKGSGFYKNDSRSSGSKAPASSSSDSSSKSESKTETKSETTSSSSTPAKSESKPATSTTSTT